METPDNFEHIHEPVLALNAFKIILKGKNIYFHTKSEKEVSLEYPFLIESKLSYSSDLEPKLTNDIHFKFELFDLHIEQYLELIKISELRENDEIKNIVFVNDLTNKTSRKIKGRDFNFPIIPKYTNMESLWFLLKLEKATGELIPLPRFTSKRQDQIIKENIDKSLSKKEAKEILSNLKSDDSKMVCTIISTKIIDFNGKEISSRTFDPVPFELFKLNFENSEEEEKFKNEIFEIPGKSITTINKINEIPANIIEKIELFVNGKIKEFHFLKLKMIIYLFMN